MQTQLILNLQEQIVWRTGGGRDQDVKTTPTYSEMHSPSKVNVNNPTFKMYLTATVPSKNNK